MPIIELCPICGSVGFPVSEQTVNSLSKKPYKPNKPNKISACLDKDCKIAYFCEDESLELTEIKVPLWYKDKGQNVPVCYCSVLTRAEIFDAVAHGCNNIDEVQEYTCKDITGKCKTENPLGLCCRNVFLWEIAKAKENKNKNRINTKGKK